MRHAILIMFLAACASLSAQTAAHSAWMAAFNTFGISEKWSVHLDVQLRSTDRAEQIQSTLIRPGINYRFQPNQFLTGGYAWAPNRYYHSIDNELLGEQRLWQQYLWMQPAGGNFIQHRLRFEQRWVPIPSIEGNDLYADGRRFSTRLRYFVRYVIPLEKQNERFSRGMFIAPQKELFLNTSHRDSVNGAIFDQSRLYGAMGFRFARSFDLEVGYMWQYVMRRAELGDLNNQVIQVAGYWRI